MKNNKKQVAFAISKYVRISPFKVRRVLDQIRGRSYEEASMILKFMPYKACPVIAKVLASALSNAKRYSQATGANFFISEARSDAGPILKRFCPHAQGRGFPIKKRMCHIIIKLDLI